jgi:hypothetical protein
MQAMTGTSQIVSVGCSPGIHRGTGTKICPLTLSGTIRAILSSAEFGMVLLYPCPTRPIAIPTTSACESTDDAEVGIKLMVSQRGMPIDN